MYAKREPTPFMMVDAAKAAFDWGLASEREKFWEMFRVRALTEFNEDIRDELALNEHWDAAKAYSCFKSVMASRKFRLGIVTPKRWRKSIDGFMNNMSADKKGKRGHDPVSSRFPDELVINKCYEYETACGIAGSASNPFWHKFVDGTEQFKSLLVPDIRKTSVSAVPVIKKNGRTSSVIAGFPIERRAIGRVDSYLVPSPLIAALTYGKPGLDFVEYVASNE